MTRETPVERDAIAPEPSRPEAPEYAPDDIVPSCLLRDELIYPDHGWSPPTIGCGIWQGCERSEQVAVKAPFFALNWVLRGSATYIDHEQRPHRIHAGGAYLSLPGREYTLKPQTGYTEFWLVLNGGLAAFPETSGLVGAERPVLQPGIDLSLVRRFDGIATALRAPLEDELPMLAAGLVGLIADIVRLDKRPGSDPAAALIAETCSVLDASAASHESLERVARRHGVSYERFRKIFRQRMGCSPGTYRLRRRLDRARELLLDSDLSIADVAEELGYASPTTFSALFRSHIGSSPEQFRRHPAAANAGDVA